MPSPLFSRKFPRRQFIRQAALLAGATLGSLPPQALGAAKSGGLVGSNIYGWMQSAARERKPLEVAAVIKSLGDCGYDYLENFLNVDQPAENARFADQLRAQGLRPVSLYVGAQLHEREKAKARIEKILAAAEVCAKAGFEIINCNADPIGREKTDEELKSQAESLSDLGKGLRRLGLQLGVHQHLPEMASQAREFHSNFQRTRPEWVGFCYDVHWVWKGGLPPLEALQQYGERIVTWHLRQSRKGVWVESLEEGDIDYPAIARYARKHKLSRRFVVELAFEPGTAVTRSMAENHRLSREYVRKVFRL